MSRPVPARPAALPRRLLALALLACPAAAQDPFAPGLRWVHAPDASAPWLPSDVAFCAGGELVWAAGRGAAPRVLVLASGELAPQGAAPLFAEPAAGAQGELLVAAAPGAARLVSALQVDDPDAQHRRPRLRAHDALAAAAGAPFAPAWTFDAARSGNGAARLALGRGGALAVLAAHDAWSGLLSVDWIDTARGAALAHLETPAQALRAVALSDDGQRLALVAGAELLVLRADGAVLQRLPLGLSTHALALSGDGRTLAVGAGASLRVWRDVAGLFVEQPPIPGLPGETAVRAALSRAGEGLALGWWRASGAGVRFELRDGVAGGALVEVLRPGVPGALQDFPQAVAVTPDGARAAFGAWGRLGPEPELLLVDRGSPQPVLALDLPGSALCLALDDTGTRVAVGLKHGHANQFASTGELRLYDTGERDLQVLGAPRLGGVLHVAARIPGAGAVLVLAGAPLDAAAALPGLSGALWLDRRRLRGVIPTMADPSGRADVAIPLPASTALLGLELGLQAVGRVGGTWQATAARALPAIL